MRTRYFALISSMALSVSATAIADPANTSAAAAAAPEPMTQSTPLPHSERTDVPDAAVQPASATDDDHKVICHHKVHEGTVLPEQICLTKQAWERVRLQAQKNVSDWQMHGYQAGVR
jgi:hypothetical protein